MAVDHKMVKIWTGINPGKIKCDICETLPATKKREYTAPSKIKKFKNCITIHHCDNCHKKHIPRRKH